VKHRVSKLFLTSASLLLSSPVSRCAKPISSDSDIQVQENDFLESFKVNTLGLVNVVHAFLPLVRKGSVKKVVNLSTGVADIDLIHKTELAIGAPYAASKAAANVVVAKYAAALKEEGILFLSMSPGYVSTEANLEGKSNH
jgi:NAD(P)-dependent dehydrogenase (short-subunit alcohol dehydrogenase family)